MKIVAVNDEYMIPVRFYHWWPGREYKEACTMPSAILKKAREHKARYVTVAKVSIITGETEDGVVVGVAYCGRKDTPSKRMGRKIALGRLKKELAERGWRLNVV